eukprot:3698410-Rhodomonas_salina.1
MQGNCEVLTLDVVGGLSGDDVLRAAFFCGFSVGSRWLVGGVLCGRAGCGRVDVCRAGALLRSQDRLSSSLLYNHFRIACARRWVHSLGALMDGMHGSMDR